MYNKHQWVYGEKIDAPKLNNIEEGISNIDQTSAKKDGSLQTNLNAEKLNGKTINDLTQKNDYVANNSYAVTSGTATAYTITLNPPPTAYVDGMQVTILPHIDSGATPTLNINGLEALTIVKQDGSAIAIGDIKANKPLSLVRVGSNFFIRSVSGGNSTILKYKSSLDYLATIVPFNNIRRPHIFMQKNSGYYKYVSTGQTNKMITRTEYNTNGVLIDTKTVTLSSFYFYANYIYYYKNKIVIYHRIGTSSGQLSFTVLDENLNILSTYPINSGSESYLHLYTSYCEDGQYAINQSDYPKISLFKNATLIRELPYESTSQLYGNCEYINNDYVITSYFGSSSSSYNVAVINISDGTIVKDNTLYINGFEFGKVIGKLLQFTQIQSI